MAKIMLVDDELSIKMAVEMIITDAGYSFCYAADGLQALAVFEKEQPDLVILDVMMAKLNGFEVCRRIREAGSKVPIIILSAKGDIVDKSIGFNAGADDYVVKPFSPEELLLRVEAQLRRQQWRVIPLNDTDIYTSGDLEIDFKRHDVKINGHAVDLTPKEFDILSYLALHPGVVFSKEQLQEYVWGENYTGELTSIAVFVRKIREKIENDPSKPKYLLTVWGIGYKFFKE
ncbi:MAG: response regulator transcription factor [Deferribacteraceae bacterium]|jgi:two-component system response regulator VicR|nr:response regulator transcription factor [Deferribacteraceae bacterium]